MKGKWLIAGGLILAELALCGAISASIWAGVGLIRNAAFDFGDWRPRTYSATAAEEQTLSVSGPVRLDVNQNSEVAVGDVTIIGGAGDEVTVLAHKTGWGADEAEANAALAQLKLVVRQTGDTVTVDVDRPRFGLRRGDEQTSRVDLTITVPVQADVTASTNFGDVLLSGVEGDAVLASDFGEAAVTGFEGGALEIRVLFGSAELEAVLADSVTVISNAGEIRLNDVQVSGAVELTSDFGELRFEDGSAESLEAGTQGGSVQLADLTVGGLVKAHSDFGEVVVENVKAGSYDLQTNSGPITLVGGSGSLRLHTDFGNITVSGATKADLTIDTNSGNIRFSGDLGPGPHTVRTEFGAIELQLPATIRLDIDFSTAFGSIETDIPVSLTGSQDKDHWIGQMNGGGPSLTVDTQSGNIVVETLNP